MIKEECEGCHELRFLIEHEIINIDSNETVGIIKICLNCANKMLEKGKLKIQETESSMAVEP